jgi:hypothetical protein
MEAICNAVDNERYRATQKPEEDSEEELELDVSDLAESEAEASYFEGYQTWLVETGGLRRT